MLEAVLNSCCCPAWCRVAVALVSFRSVICRKLAGAPLSCGLGPWGLPGSESWRGLAVCFGQGSSRAKILVRTEYLARPHFDPRDESEFVIWHWLVRLFSVLMIRGDTGVVLSSGRKQLKPFLQGRMGKVLRKPSLERAWPSHHSLQVFGGSGKNENKGWTPLFWQKLSNLYILVKEGWGLWGVRAARPVPVCCRDPAEVAFGWWPLAHRWP